MSDGTASQQSAFKLRKKENIQTEQYIYEHSVLKNVLGGSGS